MTAERNALPREISPFAHREADGELLNFELEWRAALQLHAPEPELPRSLPRSTDLYLLQANSSQVSQSASVPLAELVAALVEALAPLRAAGLPLDVGGRGSPSTSHGRAGSTLRYDLRTSSTFSCDIARAVSRYSRSPAASRASAWSLK